MNNVIKKNQEIITSHDSGNTEVKHEEDDIVIEQFTSNSDFFPSIDDVEKSYAEFECSNKNSVQAAPEGASIEKSVDLEQNISSDNNIIITNQTISSNKETNLFEHFKNKLRIFKTLGYKNVFENSYVIESSTLLAVLITIVLFSTTIFDKLLSYIHIFGDNTNANTIILFILMYIVFSRLMRYLISLMYLIIKVFFRIRFSINTKNDDKKNVIDTLKKSTKDFFNSLSKIRIKPYLKEIDYNNIYNLPYSKDNDIIDK